MTYDIAVRLQHFGIPFVVSSIFFTSHSPSFVRMARNFELATRKVYSGVWTDYGLSSAVCGMGRLVLPNSNAEAEQVERGLGIDRERIRVIPNGVEDRFAHADPNLFVERYGVRDFILNVGTHWIAAKECPRAHSRSEGRRPSRGDHRQGPSQFVCGRLPARGSREPAYHHHRRTRKRFGNAGISVRSVRYVRTTIAVRNTWHRSARSGACRREDRHHEAWRNGGLLSRHGDVHRANVERVNCARHRNGSRKQCQPCAAHTNARGVPMAACRRKDSGGISRDSRSLRSPRSQLTKERDRTIRLFFAVE